MPKFEDKIAKSDLKIRRSILKALPQDSQKKIEEIFGSDFFDLEFKQLNSFDKAACEKYVGLATIGFKKVPGKDAYELTVEPMKIINNLKKANPYSILSRNDVQSKLELTKSQKGKFENFCRTNETKLQKKLGLSKEAAIEKEVLLALKDLQAKSRELIDQTLLGHQKRALNRFYFQLVAIENSFPRLLVERNGVLKKFAQLELTVDEKRLVEKATAEANKKFKSEALSFKFKYRNQLVSVLDDELVEKIQNVFGVSFFGKEVKQK